MWRSCTERICRMWASPGCEDLQRHSTWGRCPDCTWKHEGVCPIPEKDAASREDQDVWFRHPEFVLMARGEILLLLGQADLKQKCRFVYIRKKLPRATLIQKEMSLSTGPWSRCISTNHTGKRAPSKPESPWQTATRHTRPRVPEYATLWEAICTSHTSGARTQPFLSFQGPSSKQHRQSFWIWGEKNSRTQVLG